MATRFCSAEVGTLNGICARIADDRLSSCPEKKDLGLGGDRIRRGYK